MSSHGIKDRVAIVGMGCTKFGEHWDKGTDDLLLWSTKDAFDSVGLNKDDIDAFWLGTAMGTGGGQGLSRPLGMSKPVTRVENFCATGSEALRNASYAVASGAYDVAMAVGVEKVKDPGYQGLASGGGPSTDGTNRTLAAAAMYAMCAPAYGKKYGVSDEQMREVLARIAWKNHQNGARNERAQFRKEVSMDTICSAPLMAGGLGVYDCSGVADGSAAAILVRAEDALKYTDKPLYIKGLQFIAGDATGNSDPDYDYTHFPEIEMAGKDAYEQAGVTDPRSQIAMAEVHDCFTPAELLIYEDLGFAERGTAWKEVLNGTFDLDGDLPVNPDGGLKSFGHPVGASGLRMFFENWLQLTGQAPPERRIKTADRGLGLVHNLGGYPGEMVSFVGIVGVEKG
jgi:acetyl-CoA C-acetyltransferase